MVIQSLKSLQKIDFHVFPLVVITTILLKLVGFKKTSVAIAKLTARHKNWRLDLVFASVRKAGRIVPGATCLPQAMAVLHLINSCGVKGRMRIGVRMVGSQLEAHAWVVIEDAVVFGADKLVVSSYKPILDIDAV